VAINFPIVTTFDDKAAKKADKTFGALGRKFATVFSVAAVVKFGKASVKAFQDAEREAALLRSQLEAVNLGFASPLVNEYIDNLALLSGITGGDLTNSFVALSQATGDATKAQELLSLALDVSAGTGKSLQSVSNALQRAFKGEVTSLARLRIGFTTAELKGKDFNEVLEELRERFTGSSARAADTFSGKIARLKEAVDQAQEAFGKGLVSGIEQSGQSIEDLQQDIIALGEALGSLTAGVNNFASDTIAAFDRIGKSSAVQGVLDVFDALVRGVGFVITGELVPSMDQATARLAGQERRKNEESNRAVLRTKNQILKAEQRISNSKKEQEKLSEKEKKNALALAKAKSIFDLEKIQIEAALQGQITEEERVRLQLMKAIANENVDKVKELTDKLKELQDRTAALAKSLTEFPEANDPFVMWTKTLTTVTDQLKAIATKKIVVDFLANFTTTSTAAITAVTSPSASSAAIAAATSPEAAAAAAAAQAKIDLLLGDAEAARAAAEAARAEAEAARIAAEAAIAAARTEADRIIAEEAAKAAKAAADAAEAIEASAAALDAAAASNAATAAAIEAITAQNIAELLASEAAANDAAMALLESSFLFEESIVSAMAAGVPTTEIYVNVEGSVTSAEDLAEVITDIQYNYQRTGKGLLLQSRAI